MKFKFLIINNFSRVINNIIIYYMDNYKKHIEYNKKLIKESDIFIKKYKKFYSKLEKNELQALDSYKGSGYYIINHLLYNNKFNKDYIMEYIAHSKDGRELVVKGLYDYVKSRISETLSNISGIDKLFVKAPESDKKLTLFRGVYEMKDKFLSKHKVGDKIKFNSYTSTSFAPSVSAKFIDKSYKKKLSCCFMVITIPKGVKMIYLPWFNQDPNKPISLSNSYYSSDEFELLLPRGCEFIVTKIDKIKTRDIAINKFKKYKQLHKDILSNSETTIYYLKYIGNNPNKLELNADQLISSIKRVCIPLYSLQIKNK